MSGSTGADGSHFEKYRYEPSLAAAVIFIILFGLSTATHISQTLRTRTWFMIPFVLGGILEVIGYIGRTVSSQEAFGTYTLGPYILQSVTLLIAPALFAASTYMTLGHIVQMVHADHCLSIRRTWLTKIFVAGDVVSFLMQASGAGLLASDDPHQSQTGEHIVVGGLCVQIVFFGGFVVVAGMFHRRVKHQPTPESSSRPWTKHLGALYAVSLLIFVRSIVRVVEFAQGFEGYILSHEWFLYVFDAVMMFGAMVVVNGIHPGEVKAFIMADRKGLGTKKSVVEGSDGEVAGGMAAGVEALGV